MRNLIKHILKEETDSVDPKKIKILKKFIIDYYSKTDWFKEVDFKMGSWKSAISSKEIPEIIITIYVLDEYEFVDESGNITFSELAFSDLTDEIDFLMNVLFPRDNRGRYTAVWVLDVEQQ
jgi:hypothetical protein